MVLIKYKLDDISDTTETPPIDESSGNRPGGVDTDEDSNIDTGETYDDPQDDENNSDNSEYSQETGNSQQTNPGEDFRSIDGFNVSVYSIFFKFSNL